MTKTSVQKRKAPALKTPKKAKNLPDPRRKRDTEWVKGTKGWQFVGKPKFVEGGIQGQRLKQYSITEGPLSETIFYLTPSLIPNQLSIQIYGEFKWLGGAKVRCFQEIGLLKQWSKTKTNMLVGIIWNQGDRLYEIAIDNYGKAGELILMDGLYEDCSGKCIYFGEEPERVCA